MASRGLRITAWALLAVASVQTVWSAFIVGASPWTTVSVVLTGVTLVAVLYPGTAIPGLWAVLAANAAQAIAYTAGFANPVGGVLYATLLFPFVLRAVAVVFALLSRKGADRLPAKSAIEVPSRA